VTLTRAWLVNYAEVQGKLFAQRYKPPCQKQCNQAKVEINPEWSHLQFQKITKYQSNDPNDTILLPLLYQAFYRSQIRAIEYLKNRYL
jgi:hypothetical protein